MAETICKVCKFGGTSMADSAAIDNVAKIILSDEARRYVVVSAPGKRSKTDTKVTDLLYQCARDVREKGTCRETFARIRERYAAIVSELKLTLDMAAYLDETERKITETGGDSDFAASRGEYLNGLVLAARLQYAFVDAAEIIKFKENGVFDTEYTNDLASKVLKKVNRAVIPGFYGSLPFDKIKTFSRGGSDITGSIISRAVNATLYENWTDVNGFMTADPRIVQNPKPISALSYRELRELSYMGASVLHADAIFPVKMGNIPINIKNTFDPAHPGTMIVPTEQYDGNDRPVTGIAGKKDYAIIFIEKAMMNAELGFARKVLTVLERYGVSFEHMPTGIDTLSIVVPSAELADGKLNKVVTKIREAVEPDDIAVLDNIALVATVGHGMCRKQGTAAKLCTAISRAGVNIRMIDQGSSELNIIVGVMNEDYEKCISALYDAFVK